MTKKMELLAPAGTEAAFLAALRNGADAIYLGAAPTMPASCLAGFQNPSFSHLSTRPMARARGCTSR
jgi:collagenase-like PrtC family protease